jgi:hypothetical protein
MVWHGNNFYVLSLHHFLECQIKKSFSSYMHTYCRVFRSVTIDGVCIGGWFIDNLYTALGTTNNYSAVTNLYTVQINTAPAKLLPAYCVSNSLSLATACNRGDSLASRAYVVSVRRISRNWIVTPVVFKITPRHGPHRKQPISCCRGVFTAPLVNKGGGQIA